jgi:hypothetical protein
MTRHRPASVLLLALAVLAAPPAGAQTNHLTRSVAAGSTTKIDHYTGWNNDCSFLMINIDIIQKPSHGTITPRVSQGQITNANIGSTGSCLGKPSRVLEIYYRAAKGFRGQDSFSVNMRTPNSAPVTYVYSVTVQ